MEKESIKNNKLDKSLGFMLFLTSLLIGLRLRYFSDSFIGDDAYMTFRVVNNLINYGEFNYNLGEHVYSSTTPLFVILLALISKLTSLDVTSFYLPLVVFIDLMNQILLGYLGYKSTKSFLIGGICSWVFSLSWASIASSMLGMETSLFVFLLLGTISALFLFQRPVSIYLAAFFAALACMTRPEGVLLAIAILISLSIKERKLPLSYLIILLASLTPWIVFALSYFGTLVPHAAIAKPLGYFRGPYTAFLSMLQYLVYLFVPKSLSYEALLFFFLTLFLIMITGIFSTIKQLWQLWALWLFGLLFCTLYLVKNPFIFFWYIVPLEPLYILSICFGLIWISNKVSKFLDKRRKIVTRLPHCPYMIKLLCFSPIFLLLGQYCNGSSQLIAHQFLTMPVTDNERTSWQRPLLSPKDRETSYKQIAALLKPDVNKDTVILAPEFGALGYFLPAKILSNVGHVNPNMLRYLPVPKEQLYWNNAITEEMIKGECPDYVISLDIFMKNSLLKSEWFLNNYTLKAIQPTGVWNSIGIYVYKKLACQ